MHTCPKKHTSVHAHYHPGTISEYTAKFPVWSIAPKHVRKQEKMDDNNARMDSNTTYNDDFVRHPYGPRESMRPKPKVDLGGPMQKDTTYSVDFWDKSRSMAPRRRMEHQNHNSGGKFAGDTTYNVDFCNNGPQPKNVVVKHGCSLGNSGAKFDGTSTYLNDFVQWKMPAKYLHKRQDGPQPTGKVTGPTTYQADFTGRPIPGKCPVLALGKPTIICGDHMCY
jgi:hypothetical protein